MGRQLGVQPGTQAPETMRVVDLYAQLFGQLPVDGFDNLPTGIEQAGGLRWQLLLLVAFRNGQELQPIRLG